MKEQAGEGHRDKTGGCSDRQTLTAEVTEQGGQEQTGRGQKQVGAMQVARLPGHTVAGEVCRKRHRDPWGGRSRGPVRCTSRGDRCEGRDEEDGRRHGAARGQGVSRWQTG